MLINVPTENPNWVITPSLLLYIKDIEWFS